MSVVLGPLLAAELRWERGERAVLDLGEGDDAGLLLISRAGPRDAGWTWQVPGRCLSGLKLVLSTPKTGVSPCKSTACRYRTRDSALIVTLPWAGQQKTESAAVAAPDPKPVVASGIDTPPNVAALLLPPMREVRALLKNAGHDIQHHGAGGIFLDGRRVSEAALREAARRLAGNAAAAE